jgi:hypothetical protein
MDQTSCDLLSHFDYPKTIDATPAIVSQGVCDELGWPNVQSPCKLPDAKRGVRWVLQWAAALTVLAIATCVLLDFACLATAEHLLTVAARAGALEATLPRATYESIVATTERRLARYPQLAGQLRIDIEQNGVPVGRQFRQCAGDRISVTLVAPVSAVTPPWLRAAAYRRSDSVIRAEAYRQMPGRNLRSS